MRCRVRSNDVAPSLWLRERSHSHRTTCDCRVSRNVVTSLVGHMRLSWAAGKSSIDVKSAVIRLPSRSQPDNRVRIVVEDIYQDFQRYQPMGERIAAERPERGCYKATGDLSRQTWVRSVRCCEPFRGRAYKPRYAKSSYSLAKIPVRVSKIVGSVVSVIRPWGRP